MKDLLVPTLIDSYRKAAMSCIDWFDGEVTHTREIATDPRQTSYRKHKLAIAKRQVEAKLVLYSMFNKESHTFEGTRLRRYFGQVDADTG